MPVRDTSDEKWDDIIEVILEKEKELFLAMPTTSHLITKHSLMKECACLSDDENYDTTPHNFVLKLLCWKVC